MTEAVTAEVLRDQYCGIIDIRANTTRTLLTLICIIQQHESQEKESWSTRINQRFQNIPLLKYMILLQREREGNRH